MKKVTQNIAKNMQKYYNNNAKLRIKKSNFAEKKCNQHVTI